ncbi:hypothetical protein M758_2G066500 [Ceratodon purpureus]|uniref:Uncharacterized protein n=1 Tax=Ceratodon purpureus TaxID=3225 RepID=A0A8T0IU70_CERPU|nr:hypothetical protein KC19_2G106100 [Ceratodon purpureus]KAG0625585.1 hypothetical protein M758_2G066500 [Ceratodon purpureus]
MAWGRLLQLGKPVARTTLAEFAPVWCRSFTSFSQSAMETYVPASYVAGHDSGAQAMASSGDAVDAVVCGRGDKKTKRGKRFKGSFGNCREQRGTTTRRLRRSWQLSYDPLIPEHAQPFPPVLA